MLSDYEQRILAEIESQLRQQAQCARSRRRLLIIVALFVAAVFMLVTGLVGGLRSAAFAASDGFAGAVVLAVTIALVYTSRQHRLR